MFLRAPLFALLLLLTAGAVQADSPSDVNDISDTIKQTYRVRPGGTLTLELDRGNIEVRPRRGHEVVIEIQRSVDVEDRTEAKEIFERHVYEFEQDGDDVYVSSTFDEQGGLWRRWKRHTQFRVQVLVQVPEQYNVEFSSGAGNVTIGDIDGDVEGETGMGNVSIGAVRGAVEVSTGSGNIDIEGAVGHVAVECGAGNLTIRNVQGEVEAETGMGNIEVKITRQPQRNSSLETGAGNVTVYLADGIEVDVEAGTGIGSVSTDFPLKIEGKWMSKSFEGRLNGGGPRLEMRAGMGNVTLKRL